VRGAHEGVVAARGERTLAARLVPLVKPHLLLMADRGFPSFALWRDAAATGAGLLWRVSDFLTPIVEESLPTPPASAT
jgi:hypothetical protein